MSTARALSTNAARVLVAHRLTNSIQSIARLMIGAVFVVLTNSANTRDKWIALSSGGTRTDGAMILVVALSALAASGIAIQARAEAFLVEARLVVRTLVVRFAFS